MLHQKFSCRLEEKIDLNANYIETYLEKFSLKKIKISPSPAFLPDALKEKQLKTPQVDLLLLLAGQGSVKTTGMRS